MKHDLVHHRNAQRGSRERRPLDRRIVFSSAVLVLLITTMWSYWPIVANVPHGWRSDDYSAGQLVPFVAVFLLWRDSKSLRQCSFAPCWWGGITLLTFAEAARTYGFLFVRPSIESYSLVLMMAALALLVAGWQMLRRVLWILLLLFLMFPLPGVVHNLIAGPLQRWATTGSVFLLEAFGISVSQQGNVVMLGGVTPLAVAEACSGLRMLMAFIIVAAFIAYMIKRPRWMKGVLLVSSIPVAVVCNMVRIFATAILLLYVSTEMAQKFFHDFAGCVMMPVAVMLLFGEIWLMDRIIVPEGEARTKQAAGKAKPARRVRETHGGNVADCA